MHAAMFRTLQECMAELTGIEPRHDFRGNPTQVRIYQITPVESYVEINYSPETEFTRIYAAMPRSSAIVLNSRADDTTIFCRQSSHNSPDHVIVSYLLLEQVPASQGRDILTQLLRVAYPDALMHT